MSDRFTVVFKGDIRAFDGNPLHIVSLFGEVAACGEGDALEDADTIEALRAENARLQIKCDEAYLNGMKHGWNCCAANDEARYNNSVENTREQIRAARAAMGER